MSHGERDRAAPAQVRGTRIRGLRPRFRGKSSYYLDIKKVVTRPEALQGIAAVISRMYDFEVVAGVAVGGVPLAVAVSLTSGKPFAIVRSQEKGHGKPGMVIGDVRGRRVLLVEDVTTSGGSAASGRKGAARGRRSRRYRRRRGGQGSRGGREPGKRRRAA